MQENLVRSLRSQLSDIRERWKALLHAEPVTTPLGHPGSLIHLIDWTLEEIFQGLATVSASDAPRAKRASLNDPPICRCGVNPLLTFFSAGEQALREGLVLAQVAAPALDPIERDRALVELDHVFRQIARREIELFCGVCQHRGASLSEASTAACCSRTCSTTSVTISSFA